MKTEHQQRIEEFMRRMPQEIPDAPCIPSEEVRLLRAKLIMEEALELLAGLGVTMRHQLSEDYTGVHDIDWDYEADFCEPNLEQIADGCADLSVVNIGTLSACGIHDKALLLEVDFNNLSKFQGDAHKDESGKWIKSSDHKPPDIVGVLESQLMDKAEDGRHERWKRAQDDRAE